jgi:C-terminal processing protease CtpA/Prc
LEVSISIGRTVNPVSGTNWEGVGVQPDVAVPAEQALDKVLALTATGGR